MVKAVKFILACFLAITWVNAKAQTFDDTQQTIIEWQKFSSEINAQEIQPPPSLHKPIIGIHNDALIVAGGAIHNSTASIGGNYLDKVWVAQKDNGADSPSLIWSEHEGSLPYPAAFGASVSSEYGVIVVGGTDGNADLNAVHLLRWDNDNNSVAVHELPELPYPLKDAAVTIMDNLLYVMCGSISETPVDNFWAFDLSRIILDDAGNPDTENNEVLLSNAVDADGNLERAWQRLPSSPTLVGENSSETEMVLTNQYDGRQNLLYLITGNGVDTAANTVWAFDPDERTWTEKAAYKAKGDVNDPMSALPISQSHILLITANAPNHSRDIYAYNAITDAWAQYEQSQSITEMEHAEVLENSNAIKVMQWQNDIILVSSDSNMFGVSALNISRSVKGFGWQNNVVVVVYLLLIVLIGVYFAFQNKNTNDYFRGGQHIPWWAAGCSIYATMLSSLTYVAVPALIYRTDWILMGATLMILVVSPIAIRMALPFFRQIDATSAYEYLSKRFNMPVRLFASTLFTFFHFGRIGIVLALTALALSAITPLDAWQAILIMGGLSLLYSTLGGVEAVIWTDTLQTLVLFIGAIVCIFVIIGGINGGFGGFIEAGMADNKFRMVDWNFGADSIKTWSIWVIVLGGIGQGVSSYTADQATVQRYMTTKDTKEAAKSIWTNAFLSIPSGVLFLSIGTGLYVFYKSQPEKLDPTIQIDQVFPFFIATELPLGISGLIIAGIFAAAQSTVSTSINSIATTVVTDFLRPFNVYRKESSYLNAARFISFLVGLLGTMVGLLFISPEIRSLAEEYYKVIGMFMGALGGLFLLGMTTQRTNGWGALIGIFFGVAVMMSAWLMEWADGFLFATIGILVSMFTGYVASLLMPSERHDLEGLTLYTMKRKE